MAATDYWLQAIFHNIIIDIPLFIIALFTALHLHYWLTADYYWIYLHTPFLIIFEPYCCLFEMPLIIGQHEAADAITPAWLIFSLRVSYWGHAPAISFSDIANTERMNLSLYIMNFTRSILITIYQCFCNAIFVTLSSLHNNKKHFSYKLIRHASCSRHASHARPPGQPFRGQLWYAELIQLMDATGHEHNIFQLTWLRHWYLLLDISLV